MGTKRTHGAAMQDGDESPYSSNKKRRGTGAPGGGGSRTKHQQNQQQHGDLTYGQRTVFPSLDDPTVPSDEDLECEDEADALAYLKSVRQQASGIPHLLVAPKAGPQLPEPPARGDLDYDDGNWEGDVDQGIYNNSVGDSRGYYYDGAYTALPDTPPHTEQRENGEIGEDGYDSDDGEATAGTLVTERYYTSLRSRFTALRAKLHCDPPASALAALAPAQRETSVGMFGPRSRMVRQWEARLRQTDPAPAQVAAMDKGAALRLLRVLLGGRFLRRGCGLDERTSRWLWALLARLPDRGELDHVEVGWVRELGKRAVLMMASLAEMEALREEVELQGHDGEEDDDDEDGWDGGTGDDPREGETAEAEAKVSDKGDLQDENRGVENRSAEHSPRQNPPDRDPPRGQEQTSTSQDRVDDDDDGGGAGDGDEEAEMDLDLEDGEVTEADTPLITPEEGVDTEADIQAAKARLLASLDEAAERAASPDLGDDDDSDPHHHNRSGRQKEPQLDVGCAGSGAAPGAAPAAAAEAGHDEMRSRINTRATLNMILTVAGEFYGQRDLLEFRDPFRGL